MSGSSLQVKVTAPVARGFVWLITFIGFVLATVAVGSCDFLVFDEYYYYSGPILFGFFKRHESTTGECVDYPRDTVVSSSAHFKAGGAMGVIAATFSGIVSLTLLCMVCLKTPKLCWNICSVLLAISFIAESLQFVVFAYPICHSKDIDAKCSLGKGGTVAIVSMVFLLLATVLMCLMSPPKEPAFLLDFSDVGKQSSSDNTDNNTGPRTTNIMGIVITKNVNDDNLDTATRNDDAETGTTANNKTVDFVGTH